MFVFPSIKQYGFKTGIAYEKFYPLTKPDNFLGLSLNSNYIFNYTKIKLCNDAKVISREFYFNYIDFKPGVSWNSRKKLFKNIVVITKFSVGLSFETPINILINTYENDSIIQKATNKIFKPRQHFSSLLGIATAEIDFPISKMLNGNTLIGIGFNYIQNIKNLIFDSRPFSPLLRFSYNF